MTDSSPREIVDFYFVGLPPSDGVPHEAWSQIKIELRRLRARAAHANGTPIPGTHNETLREIVALADSLAMADAVYGDENGHALRIGDLARALLSGAA